MTTPELDKLKVLLSDLKKINLQSRTDVAIINPTVGPGYNENLTQLSRYLQHVVESTNWIINKLEVDIKKAEPRYYASPGHMSGIFIMDRGNLLQPRHVATAFRTEDADKICALLNDSVK